MEGIIKNFKMGRHHQKTSHLIVIFKNVDTKSKAEKLIGKKAAWTTPSGKKISGEIRAAHGNSGAVRVIFEKSLPGQSVGTKVKVE